MQNTRLFYPFVLEVFIQIFSRYEICTEIQTKFTKKLTKQFFNNSKKPYFWTIFLFKKSRSVTLNFSYGFQHHYKF